MSWPGRLPAPVLDGSTAIYRNVLPEVDLRVTAGALGFSEVLVVHTRKAAANPKLRSLRFGLAGKGVTVSPAPGGGLAARDAGGKNVFSAPAPLMWDATVAGAEPALAGQGARSADAPAGTARGGPARGDAGEGQPRLHDHGAGPEDARRSADQAADLHRPSLDRAEYPAALDIGVEQAHPKIFWKNSTGPHRRQELRRLPGGRTEDCSGCADHIIRSLFRMDIRAVKGKIILRREVPDRAAALLDLQPESNAKLVADRRISATRRPGTTSRPGTANYTAQTAANRKIGSVHGCSGAGTIEFRRHADGRRSSNALDRR